MQIPAIIVVQVVLLNVVFAHPIVIVLFVLLDFFMIEIGTVSAHKIA
jgi:hypothetical protein